MLLQLLAVGFNMRFAQASFVNRSLQADCRREKIGVMRCTDSWHTKHAADCPCCFGAKLTFNLLAVGLVCCRALYIEYQKRRVAEVDDARLKFEISTVLAKEGIEVCMVSSTDRPDEVKFAVPLLDLDLAKLVPGCPWKFPQKIHLQALFPVSRIYSSVPSAPRLKLISTPDLKSLFSVDDVKLPPWCDGMCMAEYIPALEENLKIQVVEASASIGSRRRFIEALAPTFGRPLEADPIFCRRATVICISGIFTFLVHFVIPLQFPKQQPVLTLQSSQHCNSLGVPIMSPPINDYPWSPRWDSSEMVERIYDFLVDECQNFKKFCSDGSFNRSS